MANLDLTRYARRKWAAACPLALLLGAASYAYGDFGPPQGSGGGGGGVANPLTADLDAAGYDFLNGGTVMATGLDFSSGGVTNTIARSGSNLEVSVDNTLVLNAGSIEAGGRLNIGGSTSTYPALRYGSSAGVIEFLRADGSAGATVLASGTSQDLRLRTGSLVRLKADTTDTSIYDEDNAPHIAVNSTDGVALGATTTAYVMSSALSVTGANGLQLKDVGTPPSVAGGYTGLYSYNSGGTVSVRAVVGGTTTVLARPDTDVLACPTKVTACQAWWDASDLSTITKDGSNLVSEFRDKSGNGRTLTQATGSKQPTWTANVIGVRGGIDFDGTDNYLASTTNLLTGTEGELWMVVVMDDVASSLTAFSASDTAGDVNKFEFQPTQAATSRAQLNTYNAGTNNAVRSTTTTVVNGTTYLVRFATNGTTWTAQNNGTDESLSAVAGSNTGDWFGDVAAIDNFVMGCLIDNGNPNGVRFFNGRICELVITTTALNSQKASAMFSYLAAKWGPL